MDLSDAMELLDAMVYAAKKELLDAMVYAAKKVVENWESGDLAGAVMDLNDLAAQVEDDREYQEYRLAKDRP